MARQRPQAAHHTDTGVIRGGPAGGRPLLMVERAPHRVQALHGGTDGSSHRGALCKLFLNSSPAPAHDLSREELCKLSRSRPVLWRTMSAYAGCRVVFAVGISRRMMGFRRLDVPMWTMHSAHQCAGAPHQAESSCPRPGRDVSGHPGRMRTVAGPIRVSRRVSGYPVADASPAERSKR